MLTEHDQCTTLHFCPLCAARIAGAVGMLADDSQANDPMPREAWTRYLLVGSIAVLLFAGTGLIAGLLARFA